jgi:acyl carrier protein
MNENELKEAVSRALVTVAPEAEPESIDPDANLREQLDIDSLDFLTFVIALKKETAIDVPESDYAEIATFTGCVSYLTKATATATGPS